MDQPDPSSRAASERLARHPSRDTQPELLIRRELHRRGLRYRVHTRPEPSLRREADLVFRAQRVAVFIDGCYWHGCPEHHRASKSNPEWWAKKIERNRRRDEETDLLLRTAGWVVIRVWEHEDVMTAADRVEVAVRQCNG